MQNGRDATKRNRNIGTEKQGYSKNNKMVIPESGSSLSNVYWERLVSFKAVEKEIANKKITFLVEKTLKDTCHACTIDDVCFMLKFLPEKDLENLHLIIFRQPKRKEEILKPVWGRHIYFVEIGKYKYDDAIMLETCNYKKKLFWSNSLDKDEMDELERLKQDGHQMIKTKRGHQIILTLESVRATQLYRTLLHELGHQIDFITNYQTSGSKSSKDKEAFAHNYADKMKEKLIQLGIIPFNRILDLEQIEKDGLDINDFVVPTIQEIT